MGIHTHTLHHRTCKYKSTQIEGQKTLHRCICIHTFLSYGVVSVSDIISDTRTKMPTRAYTHSCRHCQDSYIMVPEPRHLGYLEIGLLSHACHRLKKLWLCVCMYLCVCVGHVPMCDYSSCRHDEHMILCVCVCVCVCVCPFIYALVASFSIQRDSKQGRQSLFFPLLFSPLCAIFL